ncbi:MAG: peptidylprolyl isomerase [Myxococcales bacterium]|nr:peptidylprolyl isomerase [Myxococcales bacterium]
MPRSSHSRLRSVALPLALIGSGALLHAACEHATPKSEAAPNQKPGAQGEPLATIDDVVITVAEFQDRINKQSPYVRARYTSLERKKEFLDNLVRFEVLAKEAKARGLDKDDEVVRTMKQVMIQKLMKDEFDNRVKLEDISDADCQKYFAEHPEEFNKPEEVRAAHILLKDDKAVKRVLADPRIKGLDNEAFRKLVAELSQDMETKERGGDLRYFDQTTKELPQEIVKATFALVNLGDVSGPVKTAAGLHIIKLTGRRKALTRTLDEVKAQIKNRLYRDKRTAAMEDFIKGLRAKAKVEVHEDRLAKVVIESSPAGAFNAPGVAPPGPGMFNPGAPGAPQAGPALPGRPAGSQQIAMPPPKAPPAAAPDVEP